MSWEYLLFISWFNKLLQHVVLFLCEAVLQVNFAFNFSGWRHWTTVINAEDQRVILIAFYVLLVLLICTLNNVDHVITCWNLFFFYVKFVVFSTELANPHFLVFSYFQYLVANVLDQDETLFVIIFINDLLLFFFFHLLVIDLLLLLLLLLFILFIFDLFLFLLFLHFYVVLWR